MKKLIYIGIKFLLASIAVYLLIMAALFYIRPGGTPLLFRATDGLHWKGGASYMSFNEFDASKKYDLIILGSSHAYRGYDPRAFQEEGLTAFNLGSNAQSVMNSYYVAKNYINGNNCRMLVLDVFSGPFMGDGFESTSDLIENISSEKAAWGMAWGLKDIRSINMLALRYVSKPSKPQYLDSTYVGAGYCERSDSVKKAPAFKTVDFKTDERQLHYFEELISYLKEQNIPVVTVCHPMPKDGDTLRHQQFVKALTPYLKEHNVPYIDLSLNHDLHSLHHFYDHNHLNKAGVELFNKMLIAEMKRRGMLK